MKESRKIAFMPNENNILDTVVQQSIKEHLEIIELLSSLEQEIETHSSESINTFNRTFDILRKKAKCTDQTLLEQLNTSVISDSTTQLLNKRRSLQIDILNLLQMTIPRANSVKSLMANEIQSVKKGRTALNGYRNLYCHHGGIVNKAS